MNLKDLYTATPVARHPDIIVDGNRVLYKDADGDLVVYLMLADGTLWQQPVDKSVALTQQQLAAAKVVIDSLNTALAQARTAITGLVTVTNAIKADTARIVTKTGA